MESPNSKAVNDGPFRLGIATIISLFHHPEFTEELAALIRRDGGPARAVRALRREFLGEGIEVEAPPSSAEYLIAFISYQLPPFSELNGMVFDWANNLFSDKYTWQEHESVRGLVDRTPGERSFLVKQFTDAEIREMGGLTSENVIAWADKNGYRAPVLEETVDFAKAYPDLQRQFSIVALGSFSVLGDLRCVAFLSRHDVERCLGSDWFDFRWGANYRFLLVRQ